MKPWEELWEETRERIVLSMSCRSCRANPGLQCLAPLPVVQEEVEKVTWVHTAPHGVRLSDARNMYEAMQDGHLVEPVGEAFTPPVELTCPYCGKWFPDDEQLREHELDC